MTPVDAEKRLCYPVRTALAEVNVWYKRSVGQSRAGVTTGHFRFALRVASHLHFVLLQVFQLDGAYVDEGHSWESSGATRSPTTASAGVR